MRCGHCRGEHDTVAQVRECSKSGQPDFDSIPEGYYAVKSLSGNNDIDFFRIDKPTKGQWAGWTFATQLVGGDQWFKQRGDRKFEVLRAIIAMGIKDSGELFASERSECYNCRSDLTKYASRSLGLGPTCAEKRGVGELWRRIQREWEDAQKHDESVAAAEAVPASPKVAPPVRRVKAKPVKSKVS